MIEIKEKIADFEEMTLLAWTINLGRPKEEEIAR